MKRKTIFITMLLCWLCALSNQPEILVEIDLTQSQALEVVKRQAGSDPNVKYYYVDDNNSVNWTIFADLEPDKGWEHDCRIYYVPKTVSGIPVDEVVAQTVDMRRPPEYFMNPVSDYESDSDTEVTEVIVEPPFVDPNAQGITIDPNLSAASHTYALIISGGININANYERYWNDCSFIYQTLSKRYGVPKTHIYPIMADGDNPALDTKCVNGGYKSQDLDIDLDGNDEIELAATKSNIGQTLSYLSSVMQQNDHLFIYVIDHGGTVDHNMGSYICLWGDNNNLHDFELAEMLDPFVEKNVKINVVLGQCYSGGFIDDLSKNGCVVAAASKGSESSWPCRDRIYDEFVYHWTCAVNGARS